MDDPLQNFFSQSVNIGTWTNLYFYGKNVYFKIEMDDQF